MAETMRNVLVMQFVDAVGTKKHNLRVPDPREDLKPIDVETSMRLVAEKNFIWPNVKLIGAKIVKTSTDTLDITAD